MKLSNNEIQTIFNQIGGNKALAMLGTKHVSRSDNSLLITKIKGCKKYNTIEISLNSMDLYDIKFSKNTLTKLYEFKITNVKVIENIYNDMLIEGIEKELGLYLSL